ncbi:MAG TPA: uroporphyrinogen decarboxylase family protein [Candidatus Limihabitans stercoravium]|nr:uroporphyrinogen decarboxylase family protein [Candidatus Limihabitans stercoravium]
MKMNMYKWLEDAASLPVKAMPILSFPAVQLIGISVKELIASSDNQVKAMKIVADKTPSIASVSLMDLSVEAECFGSKVVFHDDEVPAVVDEIVTSEEEAKALVVPPADSKRAGICIEAIAKATQLITDRPIFAGVIGSFSLAGRLVGVTDAMVYCYDEPDMMKIVLEKSTQFLIEYCKKFKQAGANGVVIAEPLTGLLSPAFAEEFSTPYLKAIVDAVQDEDFLVIYHNCGNTALRIIDTILEVGAKVYHFGNAVDMEQVMKAVPENVVAMGNIDPAGQFRNGTVESITKATEELLEKCGKYNNFILSSGCDIPPLAKWENIDAFFKAAGHK